MEVVGRDGSGGDGNRARSKERRKVEETDPCCRLLQAKALLCHCCCPGCGPSRGRGHVGLSLMLSPRHPAALGVAVSLETNPKDRTPLPTAAGRGR